MNTPALSDPTATAPSPQLLAKPFRFYMRKHPREFVIGVIALFFTNLLDIMTPLALKAGVDAIEAKSPQGLYQAIGAFVGLMAGVTLFRYLWRIHFGAFQHSVAENLRNRLFAKFSELGPSFYQTKPVGELMSLITNDVNAFRMAVGPGILIFLDAVFYIVMILPVMITLSWDWTWRTLILLPLVPFFMRKMESLIAKLFTVQQEKLAAVSATSAEIVSGIRVIKGFAQEDNQAKFFNERSREYENACNHMARVGSAFEPVMQSSVALGSVILLYFCTDPVVTGAISLGTFVAFHEYIRRMVWPMSAIGLSTSWIEQGKASFVRIRDLLKVEPDVPDTGTIPLEKFESLEVRGLTYRYTGAPKNALCDINFQIRAGETIGIVGPVGAGKTTLLQLLCRLYPVEKNTILVNGRDVGDYTRNTLVRTVSLVPQDAFLFSDTIAENIAYGFDAFPGMDPVERVAGVVNIDHEINEIPERYQAFLGERGVNLSGGQKQRLTIARALIRTSPVLMLDDSLSAVDGKTEKAITQALREAREKNPSQTVVLVSHRLATLKHADRILVLRDGRIEAIGNHAALLQSSPTYRHLHELQTAQPREVSP